MEREVGLYARISQDRIGAGLGVARQLDDDRALAAQLGWRVVETYVDNDTSAYSGKPRPAYERMLRDIEAGHIDAVISWHADRLHRSPTELERYISACDPRNVPTATVRAGELDLSTASGRMTARITGAVARHESEQKAERVSRAKQQAQADGKWLGGRRPFGYEGDGVTVHTVEGRAVADASKRVLAGDSLWSIAREWNSRGLLTSSEREWTASSVKAVLLRPRNAALTGKWDRVVGDAKWPALVDRELWEALRSKLTDPARKTGQSTSRKLLGSYLFSCECGQLVVSGGNGSRGQSRYACPSQHMRRGSAEIDEAVRALISAYLVQKGVTLLPSSTDLGPLREQLSRARARSEEIASLFGSGDMDAAQFRVANEAPKREIEQITREISRVNENVSLAGVADAADPAAAFMAASIERQRSIIDAVCSVTVKRVGQGRRPSIEESIAVTWKR